jgi:BirA family biotin operon repressor/biotin-[acetyl-CoA-carboxylase] ligase
MRFASASIREALYHAPGDIMWSGGENGPCDVRDDALDSFPTREDIELLGSPLARRVEVHDEVGSTQERARDLARGGAPYGTLVLARVQTGGRGRLGRAWGSPPGGLWMSLVLRPEIEPERAARITQAAAVGVAKSLRGFGVEARIKWPNDLLVGGRKVCGILAAGAPPAAGQPARPEFVILGVGLNANLSPSDLGVSPDAATTVSAELGYEVDLLFLLDALLSHLNAELERVADFAPVLDDWRAFNCTLGERVRVERAGETLEGLALDLSPEGALVLATGGKVIEVHEGDVEHLRF